MTAMLVLKNESDYEQASERADELYAKKPAPGSPEKKELDELLKALKAYEDDFVKMLKDNS
jgi:antitoxin component HigA of HigAB toxin-antitoxin module